MRAIEQWEQGDHVEEPLPHAAPTWTRGRPEPEPEPEPPTGATETLRPLSQLALVGAQQLVALAVPEEGGKEEAVEELTGATTDGLVASPKLPPVASPSKLPAMEIPGTLP